MRAQAEVLSAPRSETPRAISPTRAASGPSGPVTEAPPGAPEGRDGEKTNGWRSPAYQWDCAPPRPTLAWPALRAPRGARP